MTTLHLTIDDIPDLKGKVALITGGASGIGLAAARILAFRGAVVHVLDLVPIDNDFDIFEVPGQEEPDRNVLGSVPAHAIRFHKCDITDWAALRGVFSSVGHIDIAVANAGVSQEADYFADTFDANGDLEEPRYGVIDVNYRAVLNFVKLALSQFAKQESGSSLVLTCSATAYSPEQSLPVYSATKSALVGLIRAMRPSISKYGATINGVAPAATISKLLPKNLAAPIIQAGAPPGTATESYAVLLKLILIFAIPTTLAASWIYNVYFHPLSQFPGPLLGRASLVSFWRRPIVRVSPNELSFGSVESWKAIYGHSTAGHHPTPIKAPFYDIFGAGFKSLCIGSERNPAKHNEMRKMLSAAFSQRSLLEQEATVSSAIDEFVRVIGEEGGPYTPGINMTKWNEMISFDILGEMAFGESFHSVENRKPHFWSEIIEEHLYLITLADNLSRIGALATAFKWFIPSRMVVQNQNSRYSRSQVEKRLALQSPRKDFLTVLVDKVRKGEVDKEEMTAHVSTLA
ncbi:hypothetical protein ONZ43_g5216 [Nemania bipapillata]|uniref:Uncharacterized protein n=1 Tax=Nemania bipapillata TaxID=110536 RepID=A0ACC2IDC5_9PEZI|nr:hypothetical protein ONZ43_g5216 [Nemania bipapillata]